ncbi:arginine deiminase family protein [Pinibacter soli]|uniref:arginine deiminase n=1 Tax=Pinibacter soli TaxID=3044211 RepID=A0ABT6RCN5_9BACT|nr:arginine deiminase family protein [Pinibacter soli]MDI3320343.1 arginine deiminase family protein [Pinibacter soli]
MATNTNALMVSSEIGTLKRLLVHSPDSGLGKVVPSKAQDWLFEDIVHLDTIRRKEYDYYTKILLYFLDPGKIKGNLHTIDNGKRDFYKPDHASFFRSDKVIELQWLLGEILEEHDIKLKLVASVCAIENCPHATEQELLKLSGTHLAKVFITGSLNEDEMIFPPIPNFIFTRDIGIIINDHVLLNKPAKKARTRESLLAKYIFFYHPFFKEYHDKVIEIPDTMHHFLLPKGDEKKVTLEGGDVMVVSKDHVLIGVSERTSMEAAHRVTNILFEKNIVKKVSIVKIPKKRDYMHIDTVFTQVKRNMWVMLGSFSRKAIKMEDADAIQRILEGHKKEDNLKIIQFRKKDIENPKFFSNLEDLLIDISENDLKCEDKVKFVYSGNNQFPFDTREQWTDSCNLLALKEGVVLGYDRNDKTVEAFKEEGFNIIHAKELIEKFEHDEIDPAKLKDTLILMPSAELSRARGGFHCMSMPLLREEVES